MTEDDYVRSALPRYGRVPRGLLRDPNMTDRATRLYGLLDDYAGVDGRAFPSRSTLAETMGCSVSAVARELRALEAGQWVHRTARHRDDGGRTSTLFTLTAGPPVSPVTQGGVTGDTGPVSPVTHQEGEPREGTKPPQPPKGGGARREVPDTDPGWQAFWTAYPRKIGKGAARKAYTRALRKAGSQVLVDGALRVAAELADRRRKPREGDRGADPLTFVPHPTTWLNREGWSDAAEQLAPVDGASARPTAWRKGMPECPHHPGYHLERCAACASERLAGDR